MIIKIFLVLFAIIGIIFLVLFVLRKISKKSKIERTELAKIIKDKQKTLEQVEDEIKNNPKIKFNSVTDLINRLP